MNLKGPSTSLRISAAGSSMHRRAYSIGRIHASSHLNLLSGDPASIAGVTRKLR
jgi:hypothetical protein